MDRPIRGNPESIENARHWLLNHALVEDDYTIRLWEAEATLEKLGYQRNVDGRWRKLPTPDDRQQMLQLRMLGIGAVDA